MVTSLHINAYFLADADDFDLNRNSLMTRRICQAGVHEVLPFVSRSEGQVSKRCLYSSNKKCNETLPPSSHFIANERRRLAS